MTLTIIVGDVGSGKTLLMTYLCSLEQRPVYANYRINKENWNRLQPQMIYDISDSLIAIDELFVWLNSRVSSSVLHEYLTAMLLQSRKNKTDYIGTVQMFRTVDINFREMCDYVIIARNDTANQQFRYELMKNSSIKPFVKHFVIPYSKAAMIFPLYDTNEKIPVSPDVLGGAIVDKRDILPEVEEHIERMLLKGPPKAWSRSAVDGYCTEVGLSQIHARTIYNAIRLRMV